jgi:hypothetical protein
MEFLIGILIVSLFIGLLVRSKGDNTMDTLSKGCLYLFILVFLLIVYFLWYYPKEAMPV